MKKLLVVLLFCLPAFAYADVRLDELPDRGEFSMFEHTWRIAWYHDLGCEEYVDVPDYTLYNGFVIFEYKGKTITLSGVIKITEYKRYPLQREKKK
jgi:hypothetical protein